MYYDPLKYKLQKYSKLGRVPKACCYLKLKPVLSSWLFCLPALVSSSPSHGHSSHSCLLSSNSLALNSFYVYL